jgi:hypothetical protein
MSSTPTDRNAGGVLFIVCLFYQHSGRARRSLWDVFSARCCYSFKRYCLLVSPDWMDLHLIRSRHRLGLASVRFIGAVVWAFALSMQSGVVRSCVVPRLACAYTF